MTDEQVQTEQEDLDKQIPAEQEALKVPVRDGRAAGALKPGNHYIIKNVVRRVQSRLRRYAGPTRLKFKQFVAGRRLLRNQSMPLDAETFGKYSKEILEGVRAGALEVIDPDGWRYFADVHGSVSRSRGMEVVSLEPKKAQAGEPPHPPPAEPTGDVDAPNPPTTGEAPLEETDTAEETVSGEVEPDDLTELPGVGSGRAKKLVEAGVVSFSQIAAMEPESLAELLGVTEEVAENIIEAADQEEV